MRKLPIADRLDHLSYATIFLLWAVNVLLFAFVYVVLSYVPGNGPTGFTDLDPGSRVWTAIYYSVITATNTGYGDIVPIGFSRFFAALEAFSGLFLFALFMAKLVSRKQDIAIQHMHRLSFEGTFHDIREDLHIVRGDFDKIMTMTERRTPLGPDEWEVLRVAYQQIMGLLREVPHFYDDEHHLYRIDVRRETLLVEGFYHTLRRLDSMLGLLNDTNTDWVTQEKCVAELREFLRVLDSSLSIWKKEASRSLGESLEELSHLATSIKTRLARAYPI